MSIFPAKWALYARKANQQNVSRATRASGKCQFSRIRLHVVRFLISTLFGGHHPTRSGHRVSAITVRF
jgi:hypothetical protein